jgi:transposase
MRYELTDGEWAAIRLMFPNKPRSVPRVDDRPVLNGIFWVLRSGAPRRDLPERFGPYTTCYNGFVRWRRAVVWERTLERCGRSGGFNHDEIIVLPLEARCGKVRGAGAQQAPVDLIALEVHRRGGLVFGPNLDAWRLGEVQKDLRWRALGKLSAIEIDPNLDAAIGGARERLHDGPIS